MEQPRNNSSKRSKGKAVPVKKKTAPGLSRDEERSINKKRIKRRRKLKKLLALGALALVVICVGVLLALTVFFKIKTVQITGDRVYSDSQITEQSGIELDSSLFSVNEEKLNEILPEKLPYIKNVELTRKLPDTLIVNVYSTRELAAFVSGDGYILVDETGKVLDKDASMLRENVAVVEGVKLKTSDEGKTVALENEKLTSDFITLISTLESSKFNGVTEIILGDDGSFKLLYEDRITIKLGATENLATKLQRAKAAIDKENQINPYSVGVLDLKTEPYAYFKAGEEEEITVLPEYVTDENGEIVTDENGDFMTTSAETEAESEETSQEEA